MWAYFALGLSMGLSAGISPGPLLALLVTASLRSGLAGGLRVALAPFITDAPIIALSVLLVGNLPAEALRWVGTVGGLVVIWMGVNPHPYLFWTTVGAPVLVTGWRITPWFALAFLAPFYTLLVGSKMAIAWLVSRQAGALSLVWYRRVLVGCGVLILAMGGLLIWQTWAR